MEELGISVTTIVLEHGYEIRAATDNELALYRRNLLDAFRMMEKGVSRTLDKMVSDAEHRARKLCERIVSEVRDVNREIDARKVGM